MSEKNNRIEYISLAAVLSAIAVVFLHANDCFWSFSTAEYWFTANIIESVFYFAVPIFFMISGAMLIDYNKRYGPKKYFTKRITKTFIPFLAWSFIGLFIQIYYLQSVNISDVNIIYIINGLLSCQLVDVYWFFKPLFLIYLSIPLFAAIPDKEKKGVFMYLVSIAFFINILIPFIIKVSGIDIEYPLSLSVCAGFLFYTLMGYLIHNYELKRKHRWIIYLLAICGLLMHIIGTYDLSMAAGEIIETYKGCTNLPATLYSVGVFVFIKYDLVKLMRLNWFNRFVSFTDFYTFGIYLIHWYLLHFLIRTLQIDYTSLTYRLLAPFAVLAMSIAVIYVLRKIPAVRMIVP